MKITEEQIKQQLNNTLGELWAIQFIHFTPDDNDRRVEYYNNEQEALNDYNNLKEQLEKETVAQGYHIVIKEPVKVEYTLILTELT